MRAEGHLPQCAGTSQHAHRSPSQTQQWPGGSPYTASAQYDERSYCWRSVLAASRWVRPGHVPIARRRPAEALGQRD